MKQPIKLLTFISILLLLAAPLTAQTDKATPVATLIAIVDVSVVPMTENILLPHQTVLVQGDRIQKIGPAAKTQVPAGSLVIDGRNKYLMPGLADMHVHLLPGTGANRSDLLNQQLTLFLANGVTSVRNMIGTPAHIHARELVNKGELLGPTIFTAGPPLLGNNTSSPEAGRRAVEEQKKAGYDLIKVHEGLSPETYEAIAATAKQLGIPFAGHVTATVGLQRALDARQSSIEHLDGYIRASIRSDASIEVPPGQIILGPALDSVDDSKLSAAVRSTRQAGVWNCPTLALFNLIVSDTSPDELSSWPELQFVPEKMKANFVKQKASTMNMAPVAERQKFSALRNRLIVELNKAGGRLLTGSDSPQFFLVPGFATHRELESFVNAGLSPFEALVSATHNPSRYLAEALKISDDFGTVEAGKRADLLLLEANPLENVRNTANPLGVMVRGRWISKADLSGMLNDLRTLNSPASK